MAARSGCRRSPGGRAWSARWPAGSCAALQAAGYVTRGADGSDGRAVVVSITAKGRDAYRRLRAASVAAAGEALAGWKADELAELARHAARMADDFGAARA